MARADKRKRVPPLRVSSKTRNLIREIREISPRKYSSDDQLLLEQLQPLYELLRRRAGIPKPPKSSPGEGGGDSYRDLSQKSQGTPATADGAP